MGSHEARGAGVRTTTGMAAHIVALLRDLERGGVLNSYQAARYRESWPDVEQLAASPYFASVREHTRVYLGIPCREGPEMRRIFGIESIGGSPNPTPRKGATTCPT